jgi:hypothetical protein
LGALDLVDETELDINAESDGQIIFSWYMDADHVFEASVDEVGSVFFAGRFGGDRIQGKENVQTSNFVILFEKISQFYEESPQYAGTVVVSAPTL